MQKYRTQNIIENPIKCSCMAMPFFGHFKFIYESDRCDCMAGILSNILTIKVIKFRRSDGWFNLNNEPILKCKMDADFFLLKYVRKQILELCVCVMRAQHELIKFVEHITCVCKLSARLFHIFYLIFPYSHHR